MVSADNAAPTFEASHTDAPERILEIKPATKASPAPDTLITLEESDGVAKPPLLYL